MKKNRITYVIYTLIVILFFATFIPADRAYADDKEYPTGGNNTEISRFKYTAMAVTDTGYVRILREMGSDGEWSGKMIIEEYNDKFEIKSKRIIKGELPRYGGFYSGKDAYYFVFGKNNLEENDNAEVIRVVKYDKKWKRLGACSIKSGSGDSFKQVRYPFDDFGLDMYEVNGKLYIATAHEAYVDEAVGQGHSGFYMLQIDEKTMKGGVVDYDLWHSFSQHLAAKDKDNIFVLEESEGSRCAKISRFSESDPDRRDSIIALQYGGQRTSAWAIETYATADGIAVTDSSVITVGSSIDQSRYNDPDYDNHYNVYVTVTPLNNFTTDATKFRWVTNYTGGFVRCKNIHLVKINNNRLLLMWEMDNELNDVEGYDTLTRGRIHYVFLDGKGNNVSKEFVAKASISDCSPVIKNGKIVFYTSGSLNIDFYTIDVTTGAFSKKVYNIAGNNSIWDVKDGVMTFSGKGAVNSQVCEAIGLYSKKLNEIKICEGITEIKAFALENAECERVYLPQSLRTLGACFLSYTKVYSGVVIPPGVTNIDENAFYTYRGSLYVFSGSPAEKFVKNSSKVWSYTVVNNVYDGIDYSRVFDYFYYVNKYPDVWQAFGGDYNKVLEHFVKYGMKEGRQASANFDVVSYRNKYPDLRDAFDKDLPSYYRHYIRNGYNEKRIATGVTKLQGVSKNDPGAHLTSLNGVNYSTIYDYDYYLASNPDVRKAFGGDETKTLWHFVNYGMKEGRKSIAAFDVKSYKNRYADLRQAFGNNLAKYYLHYMNHGAREKRIATGTTEIIGAVTVLNGVNYSAVYDYNYYINKYADLKKAFGDDDAAALRHFVNYGMREGRQGKASFDVNVYKKNYADLRKAFGNNNQKYYLHYINYGQKEKRKAADGNVANPIKVYNGVDYSAVYDYNYYVKNNPDVKKAFGNDDVATLKHFINNGMREGRIASANFSVKVYKSRYADLRKAYGNDYVKYFNHYMKYGIKEKRSGK